MTCDNKFKQRGLDYINAGHSQKTTAEVFNIGTTTIKTWQKDFKSGALFDVMVCNRKPKKIALDALYIYTSIKL